MTHHRLRPEKTGATATAALDNGIISAITIKKPGSGYITAGGIEKFIDRAPGLVRLRHRPVGHHLATHRRRSRSTARPHSGCSDANVSSRPVLQRERGQRHRRQLHASGRRRTTAPSPGMRQRRMSRRRSMLAALRARRSRLRLGRRPAAGHHLRAGAGITGHDRTAASLHPRLAAGGRSFPASRHRGRRVRDRAGAVPDLRSRPACRRAWSAATCSSQDCANGEAGPSGLNRRSADQPDRRRLRPPRATAA